MGFMIVSGVLTMTMVYAALAPEAALRSTFGESVSGPVADIVVRNWGSVCRGIHDPPVGQQLSSAAMDDRFWRVACHRKQNGTSDGCAGLMRRKR
jgi:hypothetical protein